MLKSKSLAILAFATILSASSQSYAQTQPDAHHTNQGQITAPELAPVPQGQQDMMMNMMSGMMNMMKMMGGGQMGMGAGEMPGMGMTEHVEGRLAFLRAELQITDAQAKAWDEFAAAIRDSVKRMMENRGPMMPSVTGTQLLAQLDAQEKLLEARLASVRAVKTAFASLYEGFSPDQKKTADDLFSAHMALMPMGMMQGGMMQMMGGGAMQGNTIPGGMTPKQSNSQ